MGIYNARFNKNGNIKVGNDVWTFNKLAGSGILHGVKGTCGKHCTGCYNAENPSKSSCYVFKSYNIYPNVIDSHIRNTQAIRNDPDTAFNEMDIQISRARIKPKAIRIHASGELETAKELKLWMELAKKYPDIPFYIYTKAYEIVSETLENTEIPGNFWLNISIWHKEGLECYRKWRHLKNVRSFIYDDGEYDYKKDGLSLTIGCPAYTESGKLDHNITCEKCKFCFKAANKELRCVAH